MTTEATKLIWCNVSGHYDYTQDTNCQGAWLFSSNDGTDSSTKGNNLNVVGGSPTYSGASLPSGYDTGKSVYLDGSDDHLARAHADLSSNFPGKKSSCTAASVAFWVKLPATSYVGYSPAKGGAWNTVYDSNQYKFDVTNQSYVIDRTVVGSQSTSWVHICWSFWYTTGANGSVRWWFNGGSGTTEEATSITLLGVQGDPVGFGTTDTSNHYGPYYIYQPIVFDRVLSDAEAAEIYAYGITGNDG